VIIMAGYRIGPFDVESVLVTHDQVIEAFVVLRDSSRPRLPAPRALR